MASTIFFGAGGKLGGRCVSVVSAFAVLLAAGCGMTSALSGFGALPPETIAARAAVSAITSPAPVATTTVPKIAVPEPEKPALTVPEKPAIIAVTPSSTFRPGHSAPIRGADPMVWISTFCAGIGEENTANIAFGQSPQSEPSALLQFLDTVRQGATTTAGKLTGLGPPAVTGGKQVQDTAVGYFTTMARIYSDHRAKLAALDANDPDLAEKAVQLMPGPTDLNGTETQLNEVTNNQELAPSFLASAECQRLATPPTPAPPAPGIKPPLTALVVLEGGMLMVLAAVGSAGVIRRSRNRQEQPAHTFPAAWARPSAPTQRIPDWRATRARFAQLRGEYGQFECDPLAVLRLPALIDVTVPSTGRFVEAFAQAQALDTDTEPPPEHCECFASAVDQAWRAWRAARDAAERIRFAEIPAHELATVQRAIKLLTMARDSGHDAERIAAYAKARAELAKLERNGTIRLPAPAATALDTAARDQLPAANPQTHQRHPAQTPRADPHDNGTTDNLERN